MRRRGGSQAGEASACGAVDRLWPGAFRFFARLFAGVGAGPAAPAALVAAAVDSQSTEERVRELECDVAICQRQLQEQRERVRSVEDVFGSFREDFHQACDRLETLMHERLVRKRSGGTPGGHLVLPFPSTASGTGISAAERLLQTLNDCSAADDGGARCPLDSRSAADGRGHHLSPTVEGCLPIWSVPSAMAAPVAAGVVGQSIEERVRVLESEVVTLRRAVSEQCEHVEVLEETFGFFGADFQQACARLEILVHGRTVENFSGDTPGEHALLLCSLTASGTGVSVAEALIETVGSCSAGDHRGHHSSVDSSRAVDVRGHQSSLTADRFRDGTSQWQEGQCDVRTFFNDANIEKDAAAGEEEVVGAYEYNLRQGPLYQACTGSANMGMHTPSSGSRRRRTRATAYKLTWECLKDPWMQMREFEGWGPWPYCTLCECWSDNDHVVSKGHKKRLRQYQ